MAIVPFRILRELDNETRNFRPLSDFQREMNRLMDSFVTDWNLVPTPTAGAAAGAIPVSLDIAETPKEFKVHAEMPGMSEKEIEISYQKGVLTIRGEKKFAHEEKEKNYLRTERAYGSFFRSIPFATEVDEAKIEAEYKNGVLTVTLPKAPSAVKEAKKITIKTS